MTRTYGFIRFLEYIGAIVWLGIPNFIKWKNKKYGVKR